MRKYTLFIIGTVVLIGINLVLTKNLSFSDENDKVLFMSNIAYANGEPGGGSFTCYKGSIYVYGARTLHCDIVYNCCYSDSSAPKNPENTGQCGNPTECAF